MDLSNHGIKEKAVSLAVAIKHALINASSHMTMPQRVLLVLIITALVVYTILKVRDISFSNRQYLTNNKNYQISSVEHIQRLRKNGRRTEFEEIWDGTKELRINPQQINQDFPDQFTYSCWFFLKPSNFISGDSNKKWRSLLIKGDPVSTGDQYKRMSPGIYLTPYKNNMVCSMNTATINNSGPVFGESIILEDVPVNTWFQLTLVMQKRSFDAYINGLLEKSITFTGSPAVNDEPLIKGYGGGFDGHIAYLNYKNVPLNPDFIYDNYLKEKENLMNDYRDYLVDKSKKSCSKSGIGNNKGGLSSFFI